MDDCLYMGNINALRDWGHARNYVRMMWLILQQNAPEDFVIASGEQHSVREFIESSVAILGLTLEWQGQGVNEVGRAAAFNSGAIARLIERRTVGEQSETNTSVARNTLRRLAANPALRPGSVIIRIDPRYFRPTEVEMLLGDAAEARTILGWEPEICFSELVREMVEKDFAEARRDSLCIQAGFDVHEVRE